MSIRLEALPELTTAIDALGQLAAAQGIRFTTADYGGYRTVADTTEILGYRQAEYGIYAAQMQAAGQTPLPINQWRPIAPYGRSFHDYGAARDLTITAKPSGMTSSQALAALGALAPQVGLRWGHSFGDDPHFELAISLDDAAARWAAYTGDASAGDAGDLSSSDDEGASSSSSAAALGIVLFFVAAIALARRYGGLSG